MLRYRLLAVVQQSSKLISPRPVLHNTRDWGHISHRTGIWWNNVRSLCSAEITESNVKSSDVSSSKSEATPDEKEKPSDDYFRSIISNLGGVAGRKAAVDPTQIVPVNIDLPLIEKSKDKLDISDLKPQPPARSATLAAYVNENETLQKLVKLGVDLSKVERNQNAANHILKADFTQHIQPYIWFLNSVGVHDSELGKVLTKEPSILTKDLVDLETKINYLQSKKFSSDSIGRIVSKAPKLFMMTTKQMDTKLGILQQQFELTGI